MAHEVAVTIDGTATVLVTAPDTSLLRALRDAGHTAVTGACEQGECGSCTVELDGRFVCSCLVPAAVCADATITTVEGLVAPDLADALVVHGAVQCGFCTPGFVLMAEAALRADGPPLTVDDVRERLAGNLCRCTGYDGLIHAVLATDRSRRGLP